jgi:cytokinin dehydrogenase
VSDPFRELRTLLGDRFSEDAAALGERVSDFGRILKKPPRALARPATTAELVSLVKWARGAKVPLVARGQAHSQSGLSLADAAVAVELAGELATVGAVDAGKGTIEAGGGAIWRDVATKAAAAGTIPPVLTNNLGVTVGGTLSVAGLGVASFRHGCQGDNVAAMEVVTGAGDAVSCGPGKEQDLFDAVRSGLGQCGFIAKATLRVRPALPKVRTWYLLYDDLPSLMKDTQRLMTEDRFTFLESWCVPCPQGFRKVDGVPSPFAQWFFPLHASVEFAPEAPPDEKKLLAGLSHYRQVHVEDRASLEFAMRLEPLFELWKRGGYWAAAHPWMEAVLPWESSAAYITGVLANFPPHLLGGGHVLLWPSRGTTSKVPLFMVPKGEFAMGFGILPGLPPQAMPIAGPVLQRASDLAQKMGAKRYPSGWLDFDAARWKAHYGEMWPRLQAWTKRFDPDRVLNPGLLPLDS